ncbi:(2Fe-2S)-binding protein [Agromyces albus]|uniref:(2Fe-2S)-binding protein n=1 Tax=Agromyces albus TaxID=205332 RepID=A0A4Q2KQ87_9MICO|nr:(2Fe-2S)-binding protein [Agromyces albus]RXZ66809.1 (2Fe-2S)-binding protein [Agromyces albus]
MTARLLRPGDDPIRPAQVDAVEITLDGETMRGVQGQTIAGIVLASGVLSWRRTSVDGRPRGLFCGIGVCFDCLVIVNGERDVRACQRRAVDGDAVASQHDRLPEASA